MANPMKGEVALETGGNKYTFVLGTYALVALERRVKMPWLKFVEGATKGEWGYEQILTLAQMALLRHHPNMTEIDVADLMDAITPNRMMDLLGECIQLMQSQGVQSAPVGSENPTKPGNGQSIGMNS